MSLLALVVLLFIAANLPMILIFVFEERHFRKYGLTGPDDDGLGPSYWRFAAAIVAWALSLLIITVPIGVYVRHALLD
jgi:hypothetical protein